MTIIEKLKNIDLEKLYHFYLIFRDRSIKKVSDQYGITVPTLRYSLSTIEKQLDIKLYQSSKKSFVPTEEGKDLFSLCRSIIESLNKYEEKKLNDPAKIVKKDLVIITTTTHANYYFPIILKRFREKHPNAEIKVYSGPEYYNKPDYAFDVIVGPKVVNENLVQQKLGTFSYKFYCSSVLKQKLKHVTRPEDMTDQNLLMFSGQHLLSNEIIRKNNVVIATNSYPLLIHLCSLGVGILSCFDRKVLNKLNFQLDIEELFSDYATEVEEGYFYYNRFTDKSEMIDDLYEITSNFLKEL